MSVVCPGVLSGKPPSPHVPWACLHALALGWIWLILGCLKVSCSSRAPWLTEDKLALARAGCPWHWLMLAAGEHLSPTLGL